MKKRFNIIFISSIAVLTLQPVYAKDWAFDARDKALLARVHQDRAAICTVIQSVKNPKKFLQSKGKSTEVKGPNRSRQTIYNFLNRASKTKNFDIDDVWSSNVVQPSRCDRFLFWEKPISAMCESRPDVQGSVCEAVKAFKAGEPASMRFLYEDELPELITRQEIQAWRMDGQVAPPFEKSPVIFTETMVNNSPVKLSVTATLEPMPWWDGLESSDPMPKKSHQLARWEEGTRAWVEPVLMLEVNTQELWLNRGRRIKSFSLYSERRDGRVVYANEKSRGYLPPPWGRDVARSRLGNRLIVPIDVKTFDRFGAGQFFLEVTFADNSTTKIKFGARSSAYYAIELEKFWKNRDQSLVRFVAAEEARERRKKAATEAESKRKRQARANTNYKKRIKPLQDKAIASINRFMNSISRNSSCGRAPANPSSLDASDSYLRRLDKDTRRWADCEFRYQKSLSKGWDRLNNELVNLKHDGIKGGIRGDRVVKFYNNQLAKLNGYIRSSQDRLSDNNRQIARWNRRIGEYNSSVSRRNLTNDILRGMQDALDRNERWYNQSTNLYNNSIYITPSYN
ncbi:hypothetical protein FLL45_18750 [Aliikangiella marina]|uniref:GWxTD domain-containing protein n=1 Tax=Aliikangiella marina TaxID=1712262 RepID=A0A545T4V4_9GAMM|nr:hypothetical protein [Aliikangiella marina]TQV72259.1 hypothetical protein FLL45_18750 [Aliikangiella marina]